VRGSGMAGSSARSLAPPWAPPVAGVALVLTGVVGALGWRQRRPAGVDAWAIDLLTVSPQSFPYRFASRLDDTVRTLAVLAASLAIALVAWVLLRRWEAVVAACVVAPATVTVEMLIKLSARRSLGLESFGYPSGRTALATSLVLVLALVLRAAAVRLPGRALVAGLGSVYVLAMAWARVATSQHFLTEVVGGVCVGVAVTLAVVLALTALRHRISGPDH
jgi:membrane-associated phospholipid phosphatase